MSKWALSSVRSYKAQYTSSKTSLWNRGSSRESTMRPLFLKIESWWHNQTQAAWRQQTIARQQTFNKNATKLSQMTANLCVTWREATTDPHIEFRRKRSVSRSLRNWLASRKKRSLWRGSGKYRPVAGSIYWKDSNKNNAAKAVVLGLQSSNRSVRTSERFKNQSWTLTMKMTA